MERITGIKIVVEEDLGAEKNTSAGLRDEIGRLLQTIEELKKAAMLGQASQQRMMELENEIKRLQALPSCQK